MRSGTGATALPSAATSPTSRSRWAGTITPGDPAAPRAISVANDCGARWRAHHLVVLLVYDELPGIGEPGDTDAGPSVGHPRRATAYREEVGKVRTFFADRYDPRLVTRGLVQLPPLARAAASGDLVFALASCQYPADMTDGAPNDHQGPEPPASASMLRVVEPA